MNLQQRSANFTQLQRRFKAVRDEKNVKENELKKAYTEIEDALTQLDACAKQ